MVAGVARGLGAKGSATGIVVVLGWEGTSTWTPEGKTRFLNLAQDCGFTRVWSKIGTQSGTLVNGSRDLHLYRKPLFVSICRGMEPFQGLNGGFVLADHFFSCDPDPLCAGC